VSEFRLKRVEQNIKEQISNLIVRGEVKDPRVSGIISVTEVKVSKDIAYADVFVSSIQSEKKIQKIVDGLNNAAGFIQRKLGNALRMRATPKLRFKPDTAIEHGFHLTQKLNELSS
jgi:ribosome-binding factor A